MFDLVVFLWLPLKRRLKRHRNREIGRNGPHIEEPNHPRNQGYKAFIEWAAAYDAGGLDMCSKFSHEKWISTLPDQMVRIENNRTIQESLNTILNFRDSPFQYKVYDYNML